MGYVNYLHLNKDAVKYVIEQLDIYNEVEISYKLFEIIVQEFNEKLKKYIENVLGSKVEDEQFFVESAVLLFTIILKHQINWDYLEFQYGKLQDRGFVNGKIKRGNNIGYMLFEGNVGEDYTPSKKEYYSHSIIHSDSALLGHLKPYVKEIFCDKPSEHKSKGLKSGYTNNDNNVLIYSKFDSEIYNNSIGLLIESSTKYQKRGPHKLVYKRDIDSESKMINQFSNDFKEEYLTGDLLIFTQKKPCLSCERKIFELSRTFPNLNIRVCFAII